MRMNPGEGSSARQWLQQVGEAELAHVLRRFGEEPKARRIARAIVETRASAPIDTTGQLAALVVARGRTGPPPDPPGDTRIPGDTNPHQPRTQVPGGRT